MEPECYAIQPVHARPRPYSKPATSPARARRLDAESRRRSASVPSAPVGVGSSGGGWLDYVVVDAACELIGGLPWSAAFDSVGDVCGTIGEGVGDAIGGIVGGVFDAL